MPLITISRGIGCGGMIIARRVAEGLGIELFDDKKLQAEASRMGYRPEEIEEMDEKAPGFFDLMLSNKPHIYLDYMEALIYEVARKGEGVLVGHGSQMLLRDFECALHVHIHADEKSRIENLMKQKGLSENAAAKMIRKSDHEQRGFFRFAFHIDWADPSLYDLIINTEQLGIDTAAHLIMEAAKSDQIKTCSLGALEAMEKLGLKKRVDAALLKKGVDTSMLFVEVAQKGVVEIHGVTLTDEDKESIPEIIEGVSGVSKVLARIGVVQSHY